MNGDAENTTSDNCTQTEKNITNEVQLDSHEFVLIQLLLNSGKDVRTISDRKENDINSGGEPEICPTCLEDINQELNFLTRCKHKLHNHCYQEYIFHGLKNKVGKSY